MSKYIAYYRVSTQQQGAEGLGMAAQHALVHQYVTANSGTLIASYSEVESAAKHHTANRLELKKAVAHAKSVGATLVIAKLDRLSRSVEVTSNLLNSGVDFVACDNPHANRMSIQIMAVMAEEEARQISGRTKAALAAAKARGVKLGGLRHVSAEGAKRACDAASKARREAAVADYASVLPMLRTLRSMGQSLYGIAKTLNDAGYSTRTGKQWTTSQVSRVLKNYAA